MQGPRITSNGLDIRAPSFDSQDGAANRKAFVLKRATVKITSQDVEKEEAPSNRGGSTASNANQGANPVTGEYSPGSLLWTTKISKMHSYIVYTVNFTMYK